jgi:hypothetical protein
MKRLFVLATSALIALTGCAVSAVQTAKTNGEGNIQVGLEPGIIGVSGAGTGISNAGAFGPSVDLAVRYGISDKFDLGARLGTAGFEIQSKFQLTGDDGVVLALAPALVPLVVGGSGGGGGFVAVPVPLLIDIPVGESTLVLGPRLVPRFVFASGAGTSGGGFLLNGGASVGYAAKLADGFKLMPEFGMEIPFLAGASGGGASGSAAGIGGMIWQVKLGVLLGKTK